MRVMRQLYNPISLEPGCSRLGQSWTLTSLAHPFPDFARLTEQEKNLRTRLHSYRNSLASYYKCIIFWEDARAEETVIIGFSLTQTSSANKRDIFSVF